MRADAGRIRIGRDGGVAEGIFLRLRGSERARLAGAGKREAGRHARQIVCAKARLFEAALGRLEDRRNARLEPEPDIGRTRNGLAQDRAGGRAEPRAAFCTTAVDTE